MKLAVICDGISRDLSHALSVCRSMGLNTLYGNPLYAVLQLIGDKDVGDPTAQEAHALNALLQQNHTPYPAFHATCLPV